jgi:hypothetical protein
VGEPSAAELGDAQGLAAVALGGGCRGCGGEAESFGDGDEPVALGLEPGDELVEGGDGLGAVAAAVVHHDDAGFDGAGDGGGAGALPVLGVVVGEHEQVAGGGSAPGGVVGGGDRVGSGGVGQPQQDGPVSGGGGDGVAGEGEFGVELPGGCGAGGEVREGV